MLSILKSNKILKMILDSQAKLEKGDTEINRSMSKEIAMFIIYIRFQG